MTTPVAGESVTIGGDTAVTNEAGVASVDFDFDDPSETKTVDVTVRNKSIRMTVEMGQNDDRLEEGSNIVKVPVDSAAQGAITAGSKGSVAVVP